MATAIEWADLLSGNYEGWAREPTWPSGTWEDLIGTITLRCSTPVDGWVHATLTSLDLGTWVGNLDADGRRLIVSNDKGATLKLSVEATQMSEVLARIELRGEIRSSSGKVILGVSLRSQASQASS